MTKTALTLDGASPEALLAAAVSGAGPKGTPPAMASRALRLSMPGRPVLAATGAALLVGTLLGFGVGTLTARGDDPRLHAEFAQDREARGDAARRVDAEIGRITTTLAGLSEATDAARKDGAARGSDLAARLARVEQGLGARMVTLTEHIEQNAREQAARIAEIAGQIEKRSAAAAPPVPPKPEPIQTGALAEPKPKPVVIESWALRDVYAGTAVLEDRRRRLVELVVGDVLPGVGRVDGIERRGREWVVVTRQGLVTPQPW